jgi:hypothetical protein
VSGSPCDVRAASDALTTLGAPKGRRGSSEVPHIPQNLKFDEFSSPQFGQITVVLRISLIQFNSCALAFPVLV